MIRLSISIRRPWPGPIARVVIIVIVYMLAIHFAPSVIIPLSFGGILGSWLSASITPVRVEQLTV